MKKNYFFKTAMAANPLAMTVAKKSWQNTTTAWLLLLFTLLGFSDAFGQIAQRGAATSATVNAVTTLTITKPTGVVAGDIMLVNITQRGTDNLSNPTCTGWTLINGVNLGGGTDRRVSILYKIAGGAEPVNYTFTLDDDVDRSAGAIIAFSGVDNTTPFDVGPGTLSTANSTTVTGTGLTTVTDNAAIIMLGGSGGRTWSGWTTTSPGALTELYDIQNTVSIGGAWAIKPTAGATANGTATLAASQRNAGILLALRPTPPPPPTITSLGAASGCVGSSLTINGTNLLGATAVTIGSTPATITGTTATSVTVTVGTGTTGTVQVTTPGGTATSAATFTVNPLPAAIAGGATTVCTGATTPAFTNATAGGTWSITNGTGSATISGGGIVTGVTTGTATVVYTLGTCSVSTPITIISTPTISVNPANASTNTGGTANFSVTALNGPTSYTWQVSTNGGGSWTTVTNGGVYSGATTATLTITGATLGMNGYLYHASATNTCGTSAYSTAATLTVSNIVLVTGAGTNSVTCGTNAILKDHAGDGNYASNRNDWSVINAGLGATITLTGTYTVEDSYDFITIYDGSGIGGTVLATLTGTGTINYTGNPGQTLTLQFTSDGSSVASGFAVNVSYSGVCFPVCTTPTAQPTALMLFPASTTIAGSFTAASPASDSYLVIRGTSATPPTAPVIGTTYTIGSIYQAGGYVVVDNDTNTTFTATGLTSTTTYYFYIYSFNGLCTGGPLYLGSSPLTGNATTTVISYCEPTTTQNLEHITGVATEGTINDVSNPSGYTLNGYSNYTSIIIATQIPGGSININLSLTDVPTFERQFVRTWVDWNNDGDFDDTGELVYTTGTTATGTTSYGFLVPTAQALGDYRMRIKTRNINGGSTYNSCSSYNRGETEDYTIRVIADCPAKITGITPGSACGPTNTVTLSATMSTGSTQIRWYDALTGGTPVGTGPSFTTPVLSSSTTYYVTASNGSCETIHRTPVKATILSTTDITITPSVPEVCGEDNVVSISALGDNITETIHTQDFESELSGYTITTTGDTTPTSGSAPDAPWSIKTSPYQTTTNVWKPAINSGPVGTVGNRFAFTTSDYSGTDFTTTITSPAIDVSAYTSLTLTFDHFFSRYLDDLGTIEASTDNGASWSSVHAFSAKDGSASKFKSAPFDLTPYTGTAQLRIRFVYHGSYDDGWAIDNIKIEGVRPLNTLFTWTGATIAAFADVACTVPYTNQPVTTVYVKPTPSQLAMPSWSFTANATLGNGCIISTPVTITNKTKLWKGSEDSNWYNPNNWEPTGIPDANTCVYVYPGSTVAANTSNINTAANDGFAKVVTVRPSGVLNIHPGNDLTVTDAVTVDAGGTFIIENSGSLIQVNDVANSGSITMKRNAMIKALDYVYWSSPVASFASSAISPLTSTGLIWKWEPTTITAYDSNFGNWSNGNETMTLGRGYIVRAPGGWPTTPTLFTANFVGTPNNGTITRTITRSDYTSTPYTGPTSTQVTANDDNWNLLGNPYPSAIDADAFISTNITHLLGFVDLWTHGASPDAIADPFYQDYQLNYNPNDYLRYNHLGGTLPDFNGKIGAGQGFFVLMRDAGTMTEVATFNNSMRFKDHRNDQFFRTTATTTSSIDTVERHRIWMKLIAPSGLSSDMLVGYATGATNSLDATFDAMNKGVKVNFELYSLNEGEGLSIQGRALPFDSTDTIPLGVAISQNGIQTIAITSADGLFESPTQGIYLEDLVLNVIHDLRAAPYTFTAAPGRYENRFVLRFDNTTLGNSDFITDNHITVYTNETIHVTASSAIKQVTVYDVLGRMLGMVNAVNNTEVSLKGIAKTQSPLVVLVTLENGVQTTQKIIF